MRKGLWKASEVVCCAISTYKKQQIIKFDSFNDDRTLQDTR